MSGSVVDFQAQIASIMEVLANAAVAEICKVVDDGYAVVQLEMSQSHKENEFLRRKMKLMELQLARLRAERTKSSEGTVHNRFHGIRLLNRHNRDAATTGISWQNRARFSNRSFGNNSIQRDRQPIDVDQEDASSSKQLEASRDEQPANAAEEEPDLLIVKVEGEADNQSNRTSHPARTVEGSREINTQPAAATTEDPAVQPCGQRGNTSNSSMEVSGSDAAVLLQSETGSRTQESQQPTGFEPRAERQSLDTKSDLNGCQNLLRASLNQAWRGVSVADDGSSTGHTKVTDLGIGSEVSEAQPSASIEIRGVGLENHKFSPHSFNFSSEHTIVIDSVSSGQQVDRDFQWGQVGTFNAPQVVGSGSRQSAGMFDRNTATMRPLHPDSMRDNDVQLVSAGFRPTELNTGLRLGTGSAGEVISDKGQMRSLASFHRDSEIPGGVVQPPPRPSLPGSHFIQGATTSAHSINLGTFVRPGTVERLYGCQSCHKKFFHESDLQKHAVIHTRKRAFACTLCEKSFVCASQLQMHQNVHTGEKPFSCAQCGRKFSHSSNLKRHQKLHH